MQNLKSPPKSKTYNIKNQKPKAKSQNPKSKNPQKSTKHSWPNLAVKTEFDLEDDSCRLLRRFSRRETLIGGYLSPFRSRRSSLYWHLLYLFEATSNFHLIKRDSQRFENGLYRIFSGQKWRRRLVESILS